MEDPDPGDVFAFPDFSRSSTWMQPNLHPQEPFFGLNPHRTDTLPAIVGQSGTQPPDTTGFFKLPVLFGLGDGLDATTTDSPPEGSPLEPLHDVSLNDVDIFHDCWHITEQAPSRTASLKTWEAFLSPGNSPKKPVFITEAGPQVLDVAIASSENHIGLSDVGGPVVQSGPYLSALLALALGRGSVLFTWDQQHQKFIPALAGMRISGYSTDVLSGIEQRCLDSGRITRILSTSIQDVYKSRPGPVRVALSKALDTLLHVIQTKLGSQTSKIRSVLHLQSVVKPIYLILTYFRSLLSKTSRCKHDEDILSVVFDAAEAAQSGDDLLRDIMAEILARVSAPFVDFMEQWIGLQPEQGFSLTEGGSGRSFVKLEGNVVVDDAGFESVQRDFFLDQSRMPRFIPQDTAARLFEAGRNLRLLRAHHPQHPVSQPGFGALSNPPGLRWLHQWDEVHHFQDSVALYERRLWDRTRGQQSGTNTTEDQTALIAHSDNYGLEYFGYDEAQLEDRLARSIQRMNQTPAAGSVDNLYNLLNARLLEQNQSTRTDIDISPHWSLLPILSFGPLITAQDNIINRHYMKVLLDIHNLREHISIQKEFHLLGNGVLCSRLSHALFDPNLETAERQAGVARGGGVMGLRLSGRDTWPPASSELRLALMGILVECYSRNTEDERTSGTEPKELPGDISFAVRDLSSEEIDKCMDPGSLEALDFLRLLYKPPPALAPVITAVILVKYDRIFKLLLRVLRMLYVVGQIHRDTISRTSRWYHVDNTSLRFHYEAERFVTAIAAYFFETGIEVPWRRFEEWLDAMETSLNGDELPTAHSVSPNDLRDEHEWMLDNIMQNLFLRKRHQPILGLLDDIFTLILRFSHRSRLEATGRVDPDDDGSYTKNLYQEFRKKLDIFVTVCRGLSEKGGEALAGKAAGDDGMARGSRRAKKGAEEHTIDRLLISLDMTNFYYAQSRSQK